MAGRPLLSVHHRPCTDLVLKGLIGALSTDHMPRPHPPEGFHLDTSLGRREWHPDFSGNRLSKARCSATGTQMLRELRLAPGFLL